MKDFDRRLDDRGVEEARAIGRAMQATGLIPKNIICSTAARAKQTLDEVNGVLKLQAQTTYTPNLYATDAPGYLEIANEADVTDSIMLVGHNPMLEDLALALSAAGDEEALTELQMGFCTAGLAVIEFDGPSSSFQDGTGNLKSFLTPADA